MSEIVILVVLVAGVVSGVVVVVSVLVVVSVGVVVSGEEEHDAAVNVRVNAIALIKNVVFFIYVILVTNY